MTWRMPLFGVVMMAIGMLAGVRLANFPAPDAVAPARMQGLVDGPPAILLLPPTRAAQSFAPVVIPWAPGTVPVLMAEEDWCDGGYTGVSLLLPALENKTIWGVRQPCLANAYFEPGQVFQYDPDVNLFIRKIRAPE